MRRMFLAAVAAISMALTGAAFAADQDFTLVPAGAGFLPNNSGTQYIELGSGNDAPDPNLVFSLNAGGAFNLESLKLGLGDWNDQATDGYDAVTIVGVKAKVAGDAVLDSDSLMPQIAVGAEFKSLDSSGLDPTLAALGAKKTGTDLYLSATKLFLAQGILVNGTLRATKANQGGLLGFGATLGGAKNSYSLLPELAVAWLLSKNVAIGAEYRAKPNNLEAAGRAAALGNGLAEDAWKDIFVAWAPTKNFSLTAAYVDLGRIVPATTAGRKQTGAYLSAQLAF